jgi:hypothetical protein
MKFSLRDDDLNYFYNPEDIENNYKDIWDICPVSMSVIPFVKGDWPSITLELENRGSGFIDDELIKKIKDDNTIYPIGDNLQLVDFVNKKIFEKKIYLTLHGIHHRNEDPEVPQFNNNFGIGAEFYTSRDLTLPLKESINYLEKIFQQKIDVFTPPQNLLSPLGIESIFNNDLAICGDLPSLKRLSSVKLIGLYNYLKVVYNRLLNGMNQYPHPIINKKFKFVSHFRLQPGTNINQLYASFDEIYKQNGVFVLSTHSYAFGYNMKGSNKNMRNELINLIEYVKNKENVEFINLSQIFK